MSNKKAKQLRSILMRVAIGTSTHANLCLEILTREHSGLKFTQDLNDSYGVTAEQYPEKARIIKDAFEQEALIPFSKFVTASGKSNKGTGLRRIHYDNILKNTHIPDIPSLSAVMRDATDRMTEAQTFSMLALDFYRANKKLSVARIAKTLACEEETVTRHCSDARRIVSDIMARDGITDSPYLRIRQRNTDKAKSGFVLEDQQIEKMEPETLLLFHISATLFTPKQHGAICYELFLDPNVIRDREYISKKLGVSSPQHYVNTFLPSLFSVLEDAIRQEPSHQSLMDRYQALKSDLKYANHTRSQSKSAADRIDESKINLQAEGVKDILSAAYEIGRGAELPIFVSSHLYEAKHKMTNEDIADYFNYAASIIPNERRLRTKLIEHFRGNGQAELAQHPCLRKVKSITDENFMARRVLNSEAFKDEYKSLSPDQKAHADLASAAFSPQEYLCYFRAKLSREKPVVSKIADEAGIDKPHAVYGIIARTKKVLDGYRDARAAPDTQPEI